MSKTTEDIKKPIASKASKKDDEYRVKEPAPVSKVEMKEEIKEQDIGQIVIDLRYDDVPRNGQNVTNSSHQKQELLQNEGNEMKAARPEKPDLKN